MESVKYLGNMSNLRCSMFRNSEVLQEFSLLITLLKGSLMAENWRDIRMHRITFAQTRAQYMLNHISSIYPRLSHSWPSTQTLMTSFQLQMSWA